MTENAVSGPQLTVTHILGSNLDAKWSRRIHDLGHAGGIDRIDLDTKDLARRRLRISSRNGVDCMIALPRSERLFDGAVLYADDRSALLLRVREENWMRLRPETAEDALALGYAAGNLHWRVRFDGIDLLVALEGPQDRYLDRIAESVAMNRVRVIDEVGT